jgi:hypothetical protein
MHNFTPEDLIQYLYNETSPAQTAQINIALETDWKLREQFEEMKAGKSRLEALKMSPGRQTIDNILNYAEKAVTELTPQS